MKPAGIFADAETHRLAGRVAEAERSYRAVLKHLPEHVNAMRGLAMVLEQQGRDDAASAERDRADRLDAESLVVGVRGLFARKNLASARLLLRRSLEIDPASTEALWMLGEADRTEGRFASAVDAYRRILDIDPTHEAARYASALVTGDSEQDINEHWMRAEASRAQGDLDEAAKAYRQVIDIDGAQGPAIYTEAILAGREATEAPPDFMPRAEPFVLIGDFLPPDLHGALLDFVGDGDVDMKPSTVFRGDKAALLKTDSRSSRVIANDERHAVKEWFIPHLMNALEDVLPRLGIDPFIVKRSELEIIAHHEGDFFKAHIDVGDAGTSIGTRWITYTYYFYRTPKAFTGGDLLIYDSICYTDDGYTRVKPVDNSIVFFHSRCPHEVTRVSCRNPNLASGRFTVNGWLHKAD